MDARFSLLSSIFSFSLYIYIYLSTIMDTELYVFSESVYLFFCIMLQGTVELDISLLSFFVIDSVSIFINILLR